MEGSLRIYINYVRENENRKRGITMESNLTTYQLYLILLGYLVEQSADTPSYQMLGGVLFELYKRANEEQGNEDK